VLAAHAPELDIDVVVADESAVVGGAEPLRDAAAGFGAELVVARLARDDGTPRHDPVRLAGVYQTIFAQDRGDKAWR
jgi:hypothetical protein